MPKKLPIKLAKEPLLEAVCELRVASEVDLHAVVPGLLYTKLSNIKVNAIEQLPVNNVPAEVRASFPELSDAPLVSVHLDNYFILCGRGSVAVASKLPYQGWKRFKLDICNIFRIVLDAAPVQSIQRYSLKYINLIEEADMKKQYDLLDWRLAVGEHEVQFGPAHLRCQMAGPDGMVTALQILTGSIVQIANTPGDKRGGLVDADTVKPHQTTDIQKFKEELEDRLEAVKLENKKWVFESLKQSTIDAMGPTYE